MANGKLNPFDVSSMPQRRQTTSRGGGQATFGPTGGNGGGGERLTGGVASGQSGGQQQPFGFSDLGREVPTGDFAANLPFSGLVELVSNVVGEEDFLTTRQEASRQRAGRMQQMLERQRQQGADPQTAIRNVISSPEFFTEFAENPAVASELQTTLMESFQQPEAPEAPTTTRVVSGDSQLNRQFGLGIPENENARVEFVTDPQTGQVRNANVVAGFGGGGTTVNVGESARSENDEKFVMDLFQGGREASTVANNLTQLTELISQPETQTGALQPLVTTLQGFADDVGVDIQGVADRVGVNVGSLENKEEFDRVATQVIIEGFEKFKGNLNQKEVQLAVDAFQNLGRSEEANIEAIAASRAANELARERARQAIQARGDPQAVSQLRQNILQGNADEFQQLKNQFAEQMRQSRQLGPVDTGSMPGFAGERGQQGQPERLRFNPETGELEPVQ